MARQLRDVAPSLIPFSTRAATRSCGLRYRRCVGYFGCQEVNQRILYESKTVFWTERYQIHIKAGETAVDMIRHIQFFIAVADELHFGNAARRLGMSQPPLSQGVRRLEEAWGVRLFERSARAVALTAAGHELLPHARDLVGAAGRLDERARGYEAPTAGLRLGVVPQISARLAASLVAAVSATGSGERVRLYTASSTALLEYVTRGQLDVAVVVHPSLIAKVYGGPLTRLSTYALIPQTHPGANLDVVRLRDLDGLAWAIPPRAHQPSAYDLMVDTFERNGITSRTMPAIDDREALALAAGGQAIGLTIDGTLEATGVVRRPIEDDPLPLRLQTICAQIESQRPRATVLAAVEDALRDFDQGSRP